jgi:hypothetical protein
VLASGPWALLREHCGELVGELEALGRIPSAQRLDRDYARLHDQLRNAIESGVLGDGLLRDAIAELSLTLKMIGRFQREILANPPKEPVAHVDLSGAGGPERDPLDTRKAVWAGKHIYLGDDSQVSRLFWLLAKPVGVARSLGEVQRAVDGMETDRDQPSDDVRKAGQRVRKAVSKLRKALREEDVDRHVVITRGGPQAEPEYSLHWRSVGPVSPKRSQNSLR